MPNVLARSCERLNSRSFTPPKKAHKAGESVAMLIFELGKRFDLEPLPGLLPPLRHRAPSGFHTGRKTVGHQRESVDSTAVLPVVRNGAARLLGDELRHELLGAGHMDVHSVPIAELA